MALGGFNPPCFDQAAGARLRGRNSVAGTTLRLHWRQWWWIAPASRPRPRRISAACRWRASAICRLGTKGWKVGERTGHVMAYRFFYRLAGILGRDFSLISEEVFFDVVSFEWSGILENPGKILSKSFMSLSWTCFALALIFVQTPYCFQWVDCMTSVFTRWNLPPQVTGVKLGKG